MGIQLKTFDQFVQDSLAIVAESLADVMKIAPSTPGKVWLAIMEAAASQAIFLLSVAQAVILFARFSTSYGEDADSWGADFGFSRLPGRAPKGSVSLGIPSVQDQPISIPPGVVIQTEDGNVAYTLVPDEENDSWDVITQTYILPAGETAILATAEGVFAGTALNVQPDQLVQFGGPAYGINSVTNPDIINNGENAESDASYKARFVLYINSLSKGTQPAIQLAIINNFSGTWALLENVMYNLTERLGYFTVVLNRPGGVVTDDEIAAVTTGIEDIRAFTIEYFVAAADREETEINCNIRIQEGAVEEDVINEAIAAVVAFVNNLPIGTTLYLSDLMQVIMNANVNILAAEYSSLTINGDQEDLEFTEVQVPYTATDLVDIGTF